MLASYKVVVVKQCLLHNVASKKLQKQEKKIIKNAMRCRNGMPKSTQTRKDGKYLYLSCLGAKDTTQSIWETVVASSPGHSQYFSPWPGDEAKTVDLSKEALLPWKALWTLGCAAV